MEFDWVNKYDNFHLLNDDNKDEAVNALLLMTNEDKVKTLLTTEIRTLLVDDVDGVKTLSTDDIKLSKYEKASLNDGECLNSIERQKDCKWSWYGYSRGYVYDGYIRSDDTLVVKQQFVGSSSFLFNHKDYTEIDIRDYFKNMNAKRVDENVVKHNHDLKINHARHDSSQKQMQNPDVFTTNICIKPIGYADCYDDDESGVAITERCRNATDNSHINLDILSETFNGDISNVLTEYVDEINVTILREDISIEEHVMLKSTGSNNEVLNLTRQSIITDDLSNSYDDITFENIQDCYSIENKRGNSESKALSDTSKIRISSIYFTIPSSNSKDDLNVDVNDHVFNDMNIIEHRDEDVGEGYSVDDYVIIDMQDSGMCWRDETASGIFVEVK